MQSTSLIRAIFVALAFAAAGAQAACASVDLVGAGHEQEAHHDGGDHDHEDGAACFDVCVTHHLVVPPAAVTLSVSDTPHRWNAAAPARFVTRRGARPYCPPKDLSV